MKTNLFTFAALATLSFSWLSCKKESDTFKPVFGTMTDSRDGEVYETVTLDNQTWMAENLRYDVPGIWTSSSPDQTVDTLDPSKPDNYGRVYDWYTLMNGSSSSSSSPSGVQGICPDGWHIPSDEEWSNLEIAAGMSPTLASQDQSRGSHGTVMKSTTDWEDNGNGTNSSGFNVFPSGYFNTPTLAFNQIGTYAYFWSSTGESNTAWRRFFYLDSMVNRNQFVATLGYACRCVEN